MKIRKLLFTIVLSLFIFLTACVSVDPVDKTYKKLKSDLTSTSITENVTLPTTMNDVEIRYESDNTSVFENNGIIHQTSKEQKVFVTVYLTYQEFTTEKTLLLTIAPFTGEDIKETAFETLKSMLPSDKAINNITLPRTIGDVYLAYQSSNVSVLSDEGIITRQDQDTVVFLSVSLTYNNESVIKEIAITVAKLDSQSGNDKLVDGNYEVEFDPTN